MTTPQRAARALLPARLALMLGAGALAALALYVQAQPFSARKSLSLVFKHAPLCLLENWGWRRPQRARFIPGAGTSGMLYCTPARPPVYAGGALPGDLVTVSDLGRVVQRFDRQGRLLWQQRLRAPRALAVQGDTLLVGDVDTVVTLNAATGAELRRQVMGRDILALSVHAGVVTISFDAAGPATLVRYRQRDGVLQEPESITLAVSHARGVDADSEHIYVADTFGQRIVKARLADGAQVAARAANYPNSIELLYGNLLVAEEHDNVISLFGTALPPRTVAAGCPPGHCTSTPPTAQLYSPNDARRSGGMLIVADTDRHRVIVFRQGRVWGQFTGYNSPVSVRVLAPLP